MAKSAQASRAARAMRPLEEQTQLPYFQAYTIAVNSREGSFTLLSVTCPYKKLGCGEKFYMPLSWRRPRLVKGRDDDPPARIKGASCPHCSRTALKPKIRRKVR